LLAPDAVEFYNEGWMFLGTKSRLIDTISRATGIERKFLLSRETIKDASVGTKFSWAASRATTRSEDMAYCMLGLVQVNMPMLYGEGDRAFYRLQLEIIKQSNEHSILAWEPVTDDWQSTAVLAPSPKCFRNAARVRSATLRKPVEATTHEITNNGLRIVLPIIPIGQDRAIALLDCQTVEQEALGVWLESLGNGRYQRLSGSKLATLSPEEVEDADFLNMYLVVEPERQESANSTPHQIVLGSIVANDDCHVNGIIFSTRRVATVVKEALADGIPLAGGSHVTRRHASAESSRDQINYLLNDLALNEGEAACFRIRNWKSMDHDYISIVFGLRNGRPAVRLSFEHDVFGTNWSEEMRTNTSGDWDLLSDFVTFRHEQVARGFTVTVEVEAKKRREPEGKLQWRLAISLFRCECTSSRLGDDILCKCPAFRSQNLDPKTLKSLPQDPRGVICIRNNARKREYKGVGRCAVCGKESQAWVPRNCTCYRCAKEAEQSQKMPKSRTICDACKQRVQYTSGKHYIECLCSVCLLESKIVVLPR
jgi:hypothetical protein